MIMLLTTNDREYYGRYEMKRKELSKLVVYVAGFTAVAGMVGCSNANSNINVETVASEELSETMISEETDNNAEIENYIETAWMKYNDGDYLDAKATLNTAATLYGKSDAIESAIFEIDKSKLLEDIEEFENSQNYAEAIAKINSSSEKIKKDETILYKYNLLEQKYVVDVLDNAEATLHENGIEPAISLINEACKLLPNNSELKNELARLKQFRPIEFDISNPFGTSNNYEERTLIGATGTDIYGTEIGNLQGIWWGNELDSTDSCTVSYKLPEGYDKITGSIFIPYSWRKNQDIDYKTMSFIFYVDGINVGQVVTDNTKGKTDFSFDISGAKLIEIECRSDIYDVDWVYYYRYVLFSDLRLEKNY